MIEFLPTVLVHDAVSLAERLSLVGPLLQEEDVPMLQIDVIDGVFVDAPPTYATPDMLQAVSSMRYEVDLMVEDPLGALSRWMSVAQRICFHAEAVDSLEAVLNEMQQRTQERDIEIVVALNPETPLEVLDSVIGQLESVLLMGVHPGKNGASFLPETVDRVRILHDRYPGILIEVDGGVTPDTVAGLVQAGATRFAVGSYFQDVDPIQRLQALREASSLSI